MITVGLTGGIACGKSTVAEMLRARGYPVLDLDVVARDVVAPGTDALQEISQRWPSVVHDGVLDRKALGAIVVADTDARAALQAITHPRIWQAMEAWLAARAAEAAAAVFVEAALMVETGSYRRYDRLLVVSCALEVQRARLGAREGYDAATTERWLATQMPMAEKERVADAIVHNDSDRAALLAGVDAAMKTLGVSTS